MYETIIYRSENDISVEGSPLVIKRGELYSIKGNNQKIVRFEFENEYSKEIKEISINVFAYNEKGEKKPSLINYTYRNLACTTRQKFGWDKYLLLPDDETERFFVEVTIVKFEDGTIWETPKYKNWRPFVDKEKRTDEKISKKIEINKLNKNLKSNRRDEGKETGETTKRCFGRKKIIIGVVSLAILLAGVVAGVYAYNEMHSFDMKGYKIDIDRAETFKIGGLKCYVPEGWTVYDISEESLMEISKEGKIAESEDEKCAIEIEYAGEYNCLAELIGDEFKINGSCGLTYQNWKGCDEAASTPPWESDDGTKYVEAYCIINGNAYVMYGYAPTDKFSTNGYISIFESFDYLELKNKGNKKLLLNKGSNSEMFVNALEASVNERLKSADEESNDTRAHFKSMVKSEQNNLKEFNNAEFDNVVVQEMADLYNEGLEKQAKAVNNGKYNEQKNKFRNKNYEKLWSQGQYERFLVISQFIRYDAIDVDNELMSSYITNVGNIAYNIADDIVAPRNLTIHAYDLESDMDSRLIGENELNEISINGNDASAEELTENGITKDNIILRIEDNGTFSLKFVDENYNGNIEINDDGMYDLIDKGKRISVGQVWAEEGYIYLEYKYDHDDYKVTFTRGGDSVDEK